MARIGTTFRYVGAPLAAIALTACSAGSDAGQSDGPEPIRIMSISSFESAQFSVPQVRTAIEAAVDAINSGGGVDGRPIEADFCNDKFDPNVASTCAQRAVEEKVVAVIGNTTPHAAAILPVLEAARIPLIAGSASSGPAELRSAISYPINAGAPGMSMGNGRLAATAGGSRVAVIASDNEGSQIGAKLAVQGAEAARADATIVTMPLGAPDVTATVANVLRLQPDAVSLQVVTEDALKVVTSLRQAGYRGQIVGVTSLFPPSSIEALGTMAEGVEVTGRVVPVTSTQIPEVTEFRNQMVAADPDARLDDLALNAWTGMQLFAKVLDGKSVTDGNSVIDALDSIATPIRLGTVPDYPGVPATPENADYPRVAVFETVKSIIKDGKLEQNGDFFNPLAG